MGNVQQVFLPYFYLRQKSVFAGVLKAMCENTLKDKGTRRTTIMAKTPKNTFYLKHVLVNPLLQRCKSLKRVQIYLQNLVNLPSFESTKF